MVVLNPYDWVFHEDPYPTYRGLRDEVPAYHNADLGFWALSRYADVLRALRDPTTYSSSDGVALEPLDRAATEVASFLAMDPPRHDQLRRLVWQHFSRRRVAALEPVIRGLANQYLRRLLDAGGGDFIADFAGKVPMDLISGMLGVPPEDRDMLRGWADAVVHRDDWQAELPPSALEAGGNMLMYFVAHVNRKRREPGDDLTDELLCAEVDGKPPSDPELIGLHFLLAIAGNETTTKLLGNAVYWLTKNPGQRARVLEDPGLIPGWVEETLRYDPSSQMVARTVTRDVAAHGETIPKGARVALLIGSANRDERAFEDPDTYDVAREVGHTLAFGHGIHYCLGAALARIEGRVCLEELMRRAPHHRLRLSESERVHSPNVRGFATLPIELVGSAPSLGVSRAVV